MLTLAAVAAVGALLSNGPWRAVGGSPRGSMARMVVVDLPSCRYTTPEDRRGWKGREAKGEDVTRWYDALGVRNGPPRNYFVQSREERYHTTALEMIMTLVRGGEALESTGRACAPLPVPSLPKASRPRFSPLAIVRRPLSLSLVCA